VTPGDQASAATGKTPVTPAQWTRSVRMRGHHRCVPQDITDQINPICTAHVDSDKDLTAAQIGGSVRVIPCLPYHLA
jgi:hypothetical protein